MKINLFKIQKILDKFNLVLVAEYSDNLENYPSDFPSKLYISNKSNFKVEDK